MLFLNNKNIPPMQYHELYGHYRGYNLGAVRVFFPENDLLLKKKATSWIELCPLTSNALEFYNSHDTRHTYDGILLSKIIEEEKHPIIPKYIYGHARCKLLASRLLNYPNIYTLVHQLLP